MYSRKIVGPRMYSSVTQALTGYSHGWHFCFCEILRDFPEENCLILLPPWLGGAKKIFNSSYSRIANLSLSSVAAT